MSDKKQYISDIETATETAEQFADNLRRVADASEALLSAGLTKRALVLLIKGKTGMASANITAVLNALPALRDYLK